MKVYKLTFWASAIGSFVMIVGSFLLNIIQTNETNEKWVALAINICVGISCSAIVVMVTTKIQHKNELKKQTKEIVDNFFIFCHVYKVIEETIFNESKEISDKDRKECEDVLSKKCIEILDCLEGITFLWKNKYNQFKTCMKSIWYLIKHINESKFNKEFMKENMKSACREITLFTESKFYKNQFEEWSKESE